MTAPLIRLSWIHIPAGSVTLTSGGYLNAPATYPVAAFHIAQTPITNAQYAAFIQAGGYDMREWWTPTGWQMRERYRWTEPRAWTYANRAAAPVMGVSIYEAVAFCRWLTALSGEEVTLPTEQQWAVRRAGRRRARVRLGPRRPGRHPLQLGAKSRWPDPG